MVWPSVARRAVENVAEVVPEAKAFARWVWDALDHLAQLPALQDEAAFDRELNRATNPLPYALSMRECDDVLRQSTQKCGGGKTREEILRAVRHPGGTVCRRQETRTLADCL